MWHRMKEKQNMTPTGIELACLKSPELCSAPGQEDALSMPQRLLETASTTAQIDLASGRFPDPPLEVEGFFPFR